MDVSLLRLRTILRHAAGMKGTLLAQALRKRPTQHEDTSRGERTDVPRLVNPENVKDPAKIT